MTSRIDPDLPRDGEPAYKRDLRANLQAAKDEIEALQNLQHWAGGGELGWTVVAGKDTASAQKAVDACPPGGVVYFPPGTYSLDTIMVPHNKPMMLRGASPWATILAGKTPGRDIFKLTDPAGKGVQDRFRRVHWWDNFGFVMSTTGGDDHSARYNRCTVAGLAVGPCAIACDTSYMPSGTPDISSAWMHSFGLVTNVVVNVSEKNGNHGASLIHHAGSHYGWTYRNIWLEGVHYGITDCFPGCRRLRVAGGKLQPAHGSNPYKNGTTVFVAAHAATGRLPSPLVSRRMYWVRDADSNGFNLAASSAGGGIRLGDNGVGGFYAFLAGKSAGEFSPDGITIDRLTSYGSRSPVALANTENLHIMRIDSYGCIAPLHLHALPSLNRKEHIGPVIDALYTESPQSTLMPPGEDLIHIDAAGGVIGYLQVRGETPNKTRPPLRFRGRNYTVQCLDAVSSAAQAQPDIIIEGDCIGVYGQAHAECKLHDRGKNNHYLIGDPAGKWLFRKSPW